MISHSMPPYPSLPQKIYLLKTSRRIHHLLSQSALPPFRVSFGAPILLLVASCGNASGTRWLFSCSSGSSSDSSSDDDLDDSSSES